MKRRYRFAYVALVLVLLAGAAMPQVRTTQGDKTQRQSSTASQVAPSGVKAATTSVTGTGTPGQLVKWAGSDGTVVGNSIVTETKLGNIGIGTTTPGSTLTVQGMIETTLGGYKFPDGTIQTTAVSGKVAHDDSLAGDGRASTPLRVSAPLALTESVPDQEVLHVSNLAQGGPGIATIGGAPGPSGIRGGPGLVGHGGNDNAATNVTGGDGAEVAGGIGDGPGQRGGRGVVASGGGAKNGAKPGLAGDFQGDVAISGTLSKGAGSFKIDHPLDPENKYLYHSFVESPDMKNIYDGTVTTDANGEATVTLPDWFEALNQDFRYQLTVIDTFAQAIVVQKIKGNRFVIKTNASNVEVCWQVTGTRHDAYANKHRIPVEEQKPADERGLFLHPDAFNQPQEKGVQFVRNAAQIEKLIPARERTRQ